MNFAYFRACLHAITSNENFDEHPSAIESLRSEFPHTIQLVERTNPALPRNCYEHAFDLNSELTHWVSSFDLPELFVCSKFVAEFILLELTEIPECNGHDDDVVLYFDGDSPTHAGIISGLQVISKWGQGHIYRHDPEGVPSSYGNTIRFYQRIPSDVATKKFVEYVRQHPDYRAIGEMFEERFGGRYNQLKSSWPFNSFGTSNLQ